MRRSAISTVVLVAPERFSGRLSAAGGASAIAVGLRSRGWECDLLPLDDDDAAGARRAELAGGEFDRRLLAARAVVTGAARLDRRLLAGSALADVATRARQSGVPCYAVVCHDELDLFDKRLLDLDVVLQACTVGQLQQAGASLGTLL